MPINSAFGYSTGSRHLTYVNKGASIKSSKSIVHSLRCGGIGDALVAVLVHAVSPSVGWPIGWYLNLGRNLSSCVCAS